LIPIVDRNVSHVHSTAGHAGAASVLLQALTQHLCGLA
jgi:hypothetical protein